MSMCRRRGCRRRRPAIRPVRRWRRPPATARPARHHQHRYLQHLRHRHQQHGSTATAANVAAPAVKDASSGSALSTSATTMVPLSTLALCRKLGGHLDQPPGRRTGHHRRLQPGAGASLSDAAADIAAAEAEIGMPGNVRGSFAGSAKSAQDSNKSLPLLILAAIVVIYIVLGILYESLVHPVTVLTTLAVGRRGRGAGAADLQDGVLDDCADRHFPADRYRQEKRHPDHRLCAGSRARARPDAAGSGARSLPAALPPDPDDDLAAALGALPLAIGFGEGSELRRPLGVAIIGGLIASQLLTLLTTPVVYILMDKLRSRGPSEQQLSRIHSESPSTP
jgi:multidrug efflux pump